MVHHGYWLIISFREQQKASHQIELIDVAHANIHPCIGCIRCGYEDLCVQDNDVEDI